MNEALANDGYCFGCGPRNPIGLKLAVTRCGEVFAAHWTPAKEHQGWAGRVHGGMLALALDEALSRAALETHGPYWVTAELTTRLHAPALVGETLIVSAWIRNARRRLVVCAGEVHTEQDGKLVAAGVAKMMQAAQQ